MHMIHAYVNKYNKNLKHLLNILINCIKGESIFMSNYLITGLCNSSISLINIIWFLTVPPEFSFSKKFINH